MGISLFLHYPHLKKELVSIHVWRQTQTQSTIDNFYEEDMNLLHPRRNDRGEGDGIYRMEFPLMQWLIACVYKLFGRHILLTRLFVLWIGFFSMAGLYRLLKVLHTPHFWALCGIWAFSFSPAFFYYTINPLPDNLALCFTFWAMYCFFRFEQQAQWKHVVYSVLLFVLSALCKLPFILFMIVFAVYALKQFRRVKQSKLIALLLLILLGLLPILLWYASAIPHWEGNVVVQGVWQHHESWNELLSMAFFILTSTLPELLLNYASLPFFILAWIFMLQKKGYQHPYFLYFLVWGIVLLAYYFFEINAIGRIHDYYLFPFYPLLFVLVVYGMKHVAHIPRRGIGMAIGLLLLLMPVTCMLRMKDRWNLQSPGFNADWLKYKSELCTISNDTIPVIAGNDASHAIVLYYIHKKGWTLDREVLNEEAFIMMIQSGARYWYTDTRQPLQQNTIAKCIETCIWHKGSIWVYRLKLP